ncbi:hypothetical protein M569_00682 [Genlisea aurea]|uniref:PH domain-containing protein n=1 Tax=Genlisea aurea TaxID=192259 RepID=S8D2W9_9LAMI|nr:hypothetical protein M569_00682 [Genlisea aurea]
MFNFKALPWKPDAATTQRKDVVCSVDVEALHSEISDLEDRESHYKAQLEHVNEILRSSRLSGYLFLRTRWEALPGETPPIDDSEVHDWVQRFVVIQGSYIYLYTSATDLSPRDYTVLSEAIQVGPLPSLTRHEDGETLYCFYILTKAGLRYECSSTSKMQIDSWVAALEKECKFGRP